MKRSAKVMSFVLAWPSIPRSCQERQHKHSLQIRGRHPRRRQLRNRNKASNRRQPSNNRTPKVRLNRAKGAAAGPQSEPPLGTLEGALSSGLGIHVASRGGPTGGSNN